MKLIYGIILALIATGCAEQKPGAGTAYAEPTTPDGNIVGGTNATYKSTEDASVVIISTENKDGHNEICTGTFISDKLILTAAHCIAPTGGNAMTITFRKKTYAKDQDQIEVPIVETYVLDFSELHEAQSKKGDTLQTEDGKFHDDMALIEFSGGLPREAQAAALPKNNQLAKTNSILAIGYGRNTGVLYTDNVMATTGEMVLRHKTLVVDPKIFDPHANTFRIDQTKNKGGVCYGDSGGPSLIKDPQTKKNVVVGVASQVLNDRSGLKNSQLEADYCRDESLYLSMSYYAPYLDEYLKKAMDKKAAAKLPQIQIQN